MNELVRVAAGIGLAALIGAACSQREPVDTATDPGARVEQAISGTPLTWPATWTPTTLNGTSTGDPTGDAQGSRDVVGNAMFPALFIASDADRLFFRLRVGSSPAKTPTSLNPFGWACELDTDSNHQTYEFIANVNGIVNGDAVSFGQNTVQGSLDSPSDKAEVTLQTYSALVDNAQNATPAHARIVAAGTDLGGKGADYFIDWAIDINDFPASFSPLTTPFRLICGSSSNAQNISSDPVSATGATTLSTLGSDPVICSPSGCRASCVVDADCSSAQFCNTATKTCDAKLVNNTAIPTIAGHTPTLNGTCSAAVGTSVCVASVCDTKDNKCGLANGDGPCTTANAGTVCRSSSCAAGLCAAPGACTMDANCSATQFCNTATQVCTAKLVNGTPIPTIASHTPVLNGTCSAAVGTSVCAGAVCDTADDKCGLANGDGPCTAANAATICRAGACSPNATRCMPVGGCVVDADCPSTAYCDNTVFACTPKLANGASMPTVPGHVPTLDGTCTAPAGTSACISAVCDTADNKCGFAAGDGMCNAGNAAKVCRSGACTPGGVCAGTAGCAVDGDCAATQFCDTSASTCVAKFANGLPVPTIAGHTPALDGTCTPAVGMLACVAAVCDAADNKCGFADRDGTCTTANASVLCRSGACSPNAHHCMPVGGCLVDADCMGSQFCDTAALKCKAKLVNGTPVPTIAGHAPPLTGSCDPAVGASICVAGVCDATDNKCGFGDDHGACTPANAATVCRSALCAASGVCRAPGSCLTDGDCAQSQFCNTPQKTCTAKLANGAPLPTVVGHAPPLEGKCTPAAAAAACASAVCDPIDDKCGLAKGSGPCTSSNASQVCREGAACGTDGHCAKIDGEACGSAGECRTGKCNAGACGDGGGLPAGASPDDAVLEGGGFGCATSPMTRSDLPVVGLLVALGMLAARRRRRPDLGSSRG